MSLFCFCSALFLSGSVYAQTAVRPTDEQRAAIHACAAEKGVTLPEPPAGSPPRDGTGPRGPQASSGDGSGQTASTTEASVDGRGRGAKEKGPRRPRLTQEQRAIVDACFAQVGLTPPAHGQGFRHGMKRRASQENGPEAGQKAR
ncbi:MAG: hypothetical protein PHS57_01675 [Alphaproteobacteria bacterium]|nr:hypothetical protein [Alphaproteobacteria bacterium]